MKFNSISLAVFLNLIAIALAAPTTTTSQEANNAVDLTSNSLKARDLLDSVTGLVSSLVIPPKGGVTDSAGPPDTSALGSSGPGMDTLDTGLSGMSDPGMGLGSPSGDSGSGAFSPSELGLSSPSGDDLANLDPAVEFPPGADPFGSSDSGMGSQGTAADPTMSSPDAGGIPGQK